MKPLSLEENLLTLLQSHSLDGSQILAAFAAAGMPISIDSLNATLKRLERQRLITLAASIEGKSIRQVCQITSRGNWTLEKLRSVRAELATWTAPTP